MAKLEEAYPSSPSRSQLSRVKWHRRLWLWLLLFVAVPVMIGIYAAMRFLPDRTAVYANPEEHFKYGSTGGERTVGFPLRIWQALPQVCREYLPAGMPAREATPYAAFGLVYESNRDLPIGVSKRRHLGIDRVFLNCGACHTSTVRDTPQSVAKVYTGMPANTLDMLAFQTFFFNCSADAKFSAEYIVPEIERMMAKNKGRLSAIDRYVVYPVAIWIMRDRLLSLRKRFEWAQKEPHWGPGRVDTFNPGKAGYFNFPFDKLPDHEVQAPVDFPAVWNQRQKTGMNLHWDGNNGNVVERNKNAAFATGATPPTIDLESIGRMEAWLRDVKQPAYPYAIDQTKAAVGAKIYEEYCAGCHGANGQAFAPEDGLPQTECLRPGESEDIYGPQVGKITRIEDIATDRRRLDSFSYVLAVNMGTPYAGTPYRFCHYRKTFGYANMPLDGLWLRAPYLHNGSVPTLRDLLEIGDNRPKEFYRGYDVYDPLKVGFVANIAEEGGRKYFRFDTSVPGNGNGGHEGKNYGTELTADEKDALVEFLKTF
ncbi:MAG: cytochrome c [Pseudomonadota bacterium]|nr:cytochrome c [Pseudomonadota bacterium]